MRNWPELDPEKRYFSIGEVADYLDVNTSLVRFWEKEFDNLKPKKGQSGNRMYSHADLSELKLIYHLVKERGYTLEGARNKLKFERKETEKKSLLAERLAKVKFALENLKNQL
jgi:DNA-binding transcriptional MerR regulator